ncbi:MAG: hypothetical protein ABIB04_00140 [Patescibacteria group bacterium]
MIYLIGGPPRSGKTTLAKKLASQLRIGWVSTDFLESIVREYTPAKNYRKLFPKNNLRGKTSGTNDEMYARFSYKQITAAYIKQGKTSWKAIESFIGDCINESHDFVIEGYQIHPKLTTKMMNGFPKQIHAVFLIKKNEQALVEGFKKNSAKSDWVLNKTKNKETFQKIAKMLSYFGKYTEKEAEKYRLPVYCMDKDFLKTISKIAKKIE